MEKIDHQGMTAQPAQHRDRPPVPSPLRSLPGQPEGVEKIPHAVQEDPGQQGIVIRRGELRRREPQEIAKGPRVIQPRRQQAAAGDEAAFYLPRQAKQRRAGQQSPLGRAAFNLTSMLARSTAPRWN